MRETAHDSRIDAERALRSPFLSLAVLTLLAAPILFHGIGSAEVCDTIEERVAVTSREMWRAGEWILPTMNGEPRLQKPPLAYWLPLALADLRGSFDELTLRVPFALAALASVLLTCGIGRVAGGRDTGLIAGAVLLSSSLFARGAHTASADIILLLCVTAAWLFQLEARRRAGEGAAPRRRELFAFYACLGLGCLTKGPIVLVFTVLPLLVEAALVRSVAPLRPLWSPTGIAIFLLLSLFWPVLVELRLAGGAGGMSPSRQWILESLGKILPSEGVEEGYKYLKHPQPWHYYLTRIFPAFSVWMAALPLAFLDAARAAAARGQPVAPPGPGQESRPLLGPLPIWFLVPLIFLSLVREKKIAYILPLMPLGAVWVAATIERLYPSVRGGLRKFLGVLACVLAALLAIVAARALLFPSLLGPLSSLLGGSLAQAVEERRTGVVFAAAVAFLGVLLVRRLLHGTRALLPALALALTISLTWIPLRSITVSAANMDEGVRQASIDLAAWISPVRPIYAVERLPSGMLFYLDRRILFLDGDDPGALETVPAGAALLITRAELKRLNARRSPDAEGGVESLAGYSLVAVANPLEEDDRERVIFFEKASR